MMNDSWLGPLCAFGTSVTWALGTAGYSKLTQKYSPFAVNFARASVAFPLFLLFSFILAGGIPEGLAEFSKLDWSRIAFLGSAMVASYGLGDVFFLWSTRTLGVSGALAIGSCYPAWTLLAGYFFLNEKLSLIQGAGLALTLGSIVIVIINAPRGKSSQRHRFSWKGLALALGASLGWASNSFLTGRGGADLSPAVGNVIKMGVAIIIAPAFSRLLMPKEPIFISRNFMKKYLGLFIFESFLGSYLYVYGMAHSPLALAATLAALAPVVSVPVAVVFGIEKFSFYRTLGVVGAVLGVWLMVAA